MSAYPKTLDALAWFDTLRQDATVFSGEAAKARLDQAARAVEEAFLAEAKSVTERMDYIGIGTYERLTGPHGAQLRNLVRGAL